MKNVITFATRKGPRSYQEDYYFHMPVISSNFKAWLLAVMDGHSGKAVAEFCAKEIKNLFRLSSARRTEEALRNLVAKLNERTCQLYQGSTLSIALVVNKPRKVSVAILGDSPVVVYDKSGNLNISPEHNVRTNIEEREEAEKRGAIYIRGYVCTPDGDRGLQMSRALGDAPLDAFLSRDPEIYTLPDPQWILVASDGLFDSGHGNTDRLFSKIHEYAQLSATAEDLMQWAEDRELLDNATALVWCA